MSDAMSSVEIEDVLSSIRRLVSEDFRPLSRQVAPPIGEQKLILTPALRVVSGERDAPANPVVTPEAPKPPPVILSKPLPRLHLGAEPVIEEVVATLQQAVEAQEIEWESETGDPAPEAVAFEWTSGAWSDRRTELVEAEIIADDPAPATPSWAQEDPGDPVMDEAYWSDAGAKAAVEPDSSWAELAEAEVVAGLSEPLIDQSATPPDQEMSFDEGVLRDLVRDLIREELQGGLGERITRNVRKLVRAEIARALATREFD
ncbi:MAG: hypothetical protein ABIV25_12465 [Paracoccaceae bacterium]